MEAVSTLDAMWLWAGASGLGLVLSMVTAVGWWRQRRRADALASAIQARPAAPASASMKGFGLQTHSEFDAVLEREARLARVEGGALALLLVDIDHFAEINDRAGHRAGDAVLEEIARRLHAASGAKRAAMRMGGDEFVFLFAHDQAWAEQQARALQAALADQSAANQTSQFNATQQAAAQQFNIGTALTEAQRRYAAQAANAGLTRDDMETLARIYFGGAGSTQSQSSGLFGNISLAV
jgi:diguanylate cyclase (GGDEF)-like protein